MPWSAATSTTRGRAGGPRRARALHGREPATQLGEPAQRAGGHRQLVEPGDRGAAGLRVGRGDRGQVHGPILARAAAARRPGAAVRALLLQPQGQPGHQQQHLVAHRGQRGVQRPQLVPEHPARARRRAPPPARPPPTPAPPAPRHAATASTSAATCSPTTAGTSGRSQACASSSTPVSQVARSSTSSGDAGLGGAQQGRHVRFLHGRPAGGPAGAVRGDPRVPLGVAGPPPRRRQVVHRRVRRAAGPRRTRTCPDRVPPRTRTAAATGSPRAGPAASASAAGAAGVARVNAYQPVPSALTSSFGNFARTLARGAQPEVDALGDHHHQHREAEQAHVLLHGGHRHEHRRDDHQRQRHEQPDEVRSGVDDVPDVGPHRAAVAGRQVLVVAPRHPGPPPLGLATALLPLLLLGRTVRLRELRRLALGLRGSGCGAAAAVLGLPALRGRPALRRGAARDPDGLGRRLRRRGLGGLPGRRAGGRRGAAQQTHACQRNGPSHVDGRRRTGRIGLRPVTARVGAPQEPATGSDRRWAASRVRCLRPSCRCPGLSWDLSNPRRAHPADRPAGTDRGPRVVGRAMTVENTVEPATAAPAETHGVELTGRGRDQGPHPARAGGPRRPARCASPCSPAAAPACATSCSSTSATLDGDVVRDFERRRAWSSTG